MQQRFDPAGKGQAVHDMMSLPASRAFPHKPHISVMAVLGLQVHMITFVDAPTTNIAAVLLLNSAHDEHVRKTSEHIYAVIIPPPALTWH